MNGARLLATLGGIGRLRPAPGTWGALAALPLAWAICTLGGAPLVTAALVLAIVAGYASVRQEIDGQPDQDPSEIVIDELAGQWIALLPVLWGAWMRGADLLALWPGWIAAFVFFRLFDIWKPGPVRWADRMPGALGVMLDDLIAGGLAAIAVIVAAGIAHGVLMR